MTRLVHGSIRIASRGIRLIPLGSLLALTLLVATPGGTQQEQRGMKPPAKEPLRQGASTAGQESPGVMTKQEAEEFFSMQVLSMMNVAAEIRAGHCQQVLDRIEESLPANLEQMTSFEDSPVKVAVLNAAIKSYKASGKPVPAFLASIADRVRAAALGVESKDCFAFKKCSCFKVTSPEGVDVNTPDPNGWHYIIGSHCGFHWPKIWKMDCGEPTAVDPCSDYYPEGGSTNVRPGATGYTGSHTPMTRVETRPEYVDGRLVQFDAPTQRYLEVDRRGATTGKVFTQGTDGHLLELPAAGTTGLTEGKPQGTSAGLATGGMVTGRRVWAPVLPEDALKIGEAARPVDGVWTKVHPSTGEPLSRWVGSKWVVLSETQKAQLRNSGHATEQLVESTTATTSPSQSTAAQTGTGAPAAQSDRPNSSALESAMAKYDSPSAGGTAGRTASTQPVTETVAPSVKGEAALLADPSGRQWKYVTDPKTNMLKLTPTEAPRGKVSFAWSEKVKAFVALEAGAATAQ
jgi:hypothetical protein